MAELTTVQVRAQLSEVINRAAFAKERLFLTRRGKRIAAIVPIDDIDLLEALEDKIDIEEARLLSRRQRRKERYHGRNSKETYDCRIQI